MRNDISLRNDIAVSVVVPLYNVEKYMEKCIDSILNQPFDNIEVILVNDGSPDNSGKIADSYARNDKRVKVIHKENGGLSSARNAGMKDAKGKYIIFVDSDDWIDSQLLLKMYNKMENSDSEIGVFNVERIHEVTNKTEIQGNDMQDYIDLEKISTSNYISNCLLNSKSHRYSAWNRIYLTDFLKNHNLKFEPNNTIHSEDMLFNLECSLYVKKICSENEVLYYHLIRPGTISTSKKPDITKKLMHLRSEFIKKAEIAKKRNLIEPSIPHLTQYLFFMSMGSEINSNKGDISHIKKQISYCSQLDGFRFSMLSIGSSKPTKRNFISFILGIGLNNLAANIIYYWLNPRIKR